jgi:hypothetical protein
MLRVLVCVFGPFFGQVVTGVDGGYGANRDTGSAIDALDGIDE